ncbi:MAG: hypothetical protein EOO09_22530, partial [Chitinophagaceae bacterium]
MPRLFHILLPLLLLLPLIRPCLGQEKKSGSDARPTAVKAIILSRQGKAVNLETIRALAEGASVQLSKEEGTGRDRFSLEWKSTKAVIRAKEKYDPEKLDDALTELLAEFSMEGRDFDTLEALQEIIPANNAWGIELPDGFDSGGVSTSFLLRLATRMGGMIVCHDSFYNQHGFLIVGSPMVPLFGRRGGNFLTSASGSPVRPEDFFPVVWAEEGEHPISVGKRTVTLVGTSVDDFGKDGRYLSKGTFFFTRDVPEGVESALSSYDSRMTGSWSIGNQKQLVTAGEFKIDNMLGEDPLLRKLMEGTVRILVGEDDKPLTIEHWLISRDPDTVYLEDWRGWECAPAEAGE